MIEIPGRCAACQRAAARHVRSTYRNASPAANELPVAGAREPRSTIRPSRSRHDGRQPADDPRPPMATAR